MVLLPAAHLKAGLIGGSLAGMRRKGMAHCAVDMAGCATCPTPNCAGAPSGFCAEVTALNIVDDLNDFYERYVSSYNDGDLDAYCAFFGVPVSTVSGAGSQAYVSPTEIRGAAEAQQRSFGGSGWSHTVIVAKRIWVLDASLAVVVADLERVNVSGEVYQTARCVYNVARQNDGWKIVTVAESREALPSSDGLLDSRPI